MDILSEYESIVLCKILCLSVQNIVSIKQTKKNKT